MLSCHKYRTAKWTAKSPDHWACPLFASIASHPEIGEEVRFGSALPPPNDGTPASRLAFPPLEGPLIVP